MSLHAEPGAINSVPPPTPIQPPDQASRLHRYIGHGIAMLLGTCLIVYGFYWVSVRLPTHLGILLLLVSTSGAAGGLLFALRNSRFELPRFEWASPQADAKGPLGPDFLHLGWIGDALFGVAGAISVFLLLPNFSESSINGAENSFLGGSENSSDILEIIAVSLVAGFAGRSVLKRAGDGLLKERLDEVEGAQKKQKDDLSKAQADMAPGIADDNALALTVRQMNSVLSNPEQADLQKAIGKASSNGRNRVFDVVQQRYETDKDQTGFRERAIPVIEALLDVDNFQLEYKAYALVGKILADAGDANRAKSMYQKAIDNIPKDNADYTQLAGQYQDEIRTLAV